MPYVTLKEARDEGVPDTIENGALLAALKRQSEFIDRATGQWFESRALALTLDGNQSSTLMLPVPIIKLEALYINSDFTNKLDPSLYVVYDRRDAMRDDRRNPMIKLGGNRMTIFDSPGFRLGTLFIQGTQNQRLEGTFGFVEPDGTTPDLIKRAVLKLAIKQLQPSSTGTLWDEVAAGAGFQGTVTSETTDGHSIAYNAFQYKPMRAGLNGYTNDAEVDAIIALFKAPIKIASTVGNGGPDRRFM
jgi:hypothetical protein